MPHPDTLCPEETSPPLTPHNRASSGRLRKMQEADLEAVLGIESVSFGPYHWSQDGFRNEMDNALSRYFTLLLPDEEAKQEKVIGYCGFWQIIDEIHVTTLAIHPDYRKQHWGEILVAMIVDQALGHAARWITLEVRASNQAALNLYEEYGFRSQGLRLRYYLDNNEDAVIMTTDDLRTDAYRAYFKQKLNGLRLQLSQSNRDLPHGFDGYCPLVSADWEPGTAHA